MSVYAVDPATSGGGLRLLYEGTAGVTQSDNLQLLAVHLVRSDASPALTGHYLVDIMPKPNLPSVEEHYVASGRQVLPLVGVAALEPGDILGAAHAPLLSVPLDVLQQDTRAHSPPSGLSEVPSVSAVTASPVPAPASPLPPMLKRLSPEQRVSFLRIWARCRCICGRWFLAFTARTGPLRPSESWVFSGNLRAFSRSPSPISVPAR